MEQNKVSQFVQNQGLEGQELLYNKYRPPCQVVTHFQGTVESVLSDSHGMGPSRGREVKNNQTSEKYLIQIVQHQF